MVESQMLEIRTQEYTEGIGRRIDDRFAGKVERRIEYAAVSRLAFISFQQRVITGIAVGRYSLGADRTISRVGSRRQVATPGFGCGEGKGHEIGFQSLLVIEIA